ncbi:MAG: NUDIX hydrolase [Candidatus Marsarchaeota archaeon]|jgi:8-oxo-dGTP pyrophosphatase MutT (NUDIX family)|nr:NUDIX hydrolase [Candidatus Marsarchaeota archaeon]
MFRGAFVCVFDKSLSSVLLLNRNWEWKRKQGKVWEGMPRWGNVGGAVEAGETPLQGCIREVKEEIGIRLDPKRLVEVEVRKSPTGSAPYTLHFYATAIDRNTKISLNGESKSYKWFSLMGLPNDMLDSRDDVLRWQGLLKVKTGIA